MHAWIHQALRRRSSWLIASILFILPIAVHAQSDDAEIFVTTLMTICKLGAQRPGLMLQNFAKYPEFSAEQAQAFLHGYDGHAWPIAVHGVRGNLVLVLTTRPQMCALYGRRMDVSTVRILFDQMASNPKAPTYVDAHGHENVTPRSAVDNVTTSYIWNAPGASNRLLLMLTTSESSNAAVQALGTVTVIGEK